MTRASKQLLLVSVAVLGLVLGATYHLRRGTNPPTSPDAARPGGSLVASVRSEPRTFNRLVANDSTSFLVSALTQAKLVRVNRQTDQVEAWLAERWSASDAGQTFTLQLRDGVTFADGTPFTSADVVFSLEAVYDERVGSVVADSLRVAGKPLAVSAPDPSTVVIRFPAPFAPGLRLLDNLPMFPKHRLESALRDGTLRTAWGLTTPPAQMTGLGPFVLREYLPGQRLVFERNPRYWRRSAAGETLPYLNRLTVEIVPDQNAEMLRLEAGQLDFSNSEIRAEDYAAVKRAVEAGRLQLFDRGVSLDADFLSFNLRPDPSGRRAWLRDAQFRRAISHAVDREAFGNTVFLGLAEPIYGPITPGNRTWYSPEAPRYAYDPAQARMLLGSLGLTDRTGDGLLEDGRGAAARFTLLTQRGHSSRERAAAVLQQDLRKIGIVVDMVPLDPGALVDRIVRGEYEAIYFGFRATDTDPAVNLEFWLSAGGFHFWNPGQPKPATDWERQIDELMNRQVAAADQQERKRVFDEVQRIFGEQQPAIYFVAPRVYFALSSRVANAAPSLLTPFVLWNADELAVRSARTTN